MTNVDFLKNVSLFTGLAQPDLVALASRMGRRKFARDVIIFHKGSPGQNLYIVQSGRVRIFSLSLDGRQLSLNSFGPGECFGELSMIDGQPRSAGAIATEDTVTLILHRQDFLHHIETYPQIAGHMLQLLCARLRKTAGYAETLTFLDARSRVAAKLLQLSEPPDQLAGEHETGNIQVSQAVLASWVGLRRESVNRILSDMRKLGIIRIENQSIVIVDTVRLRDQITY